MLCYEIRVCYTVPDIPLDKQKNSEGKDAKVPELEEKLQKLNAGVYAMTSEDDFYAFVYRADDNFLDFAVAVWPEKIGMSALKKKGLKADNRAKDRCLEIFRRVCTEAEYGNGRFVRNLIEQAMLKQAQRLLPVGRKQDISKSSIQKLIASDFEVNIADVYEKKRKMPIGFAI